ncbi:MAG: DNA starvation/stationary phase protection protein [Dysgonamonadaceae bacterium]|jgi:starvation-inducible DNA-binding protein|nr:DNA starvation/stationary phase protection protein [Dysgonamonadaceae bacterium]
MNANVKNNLGLDFTTTNPVIVKLSELLANYQVFYTNLRGFHWNIQGDKFYELHELYENYYDEIAEKIDEIAERIVILGGTPDNNFSDYLKLANVKEISKVSNWKIGVNNVLETLQLLLDKLRELHGLAIKSGDQGTVSIANHGIKSFEKKIWMLSAYLKD